MTEHSWLIPQKKPSLAKGGEAIRYPAAYSIIAVLLGLLLTSAGYGLLLPVLSELLRRLHPLSENTSLHVGLVTASYAAGALISAPAWGRLADKANHARILSLSLLVGGITLVLTITASNLLTLYLWRFLAGVAAGAVSPAAQAWFSSWSRDSTWRSNYTVWSAIALNSGFLIGPLMGGLLAATPATLLGRRIDPHDVPLVLNGALLILAAIAATFLVSPARSTKHAEPPAPPPYLLKGIAPLLVNILIAAIAVGAFEVGLSIKASNNGSPPVETGLLLAECTIFMSAAQVLLLIRFIRRLPAALLLAFAWICLSLGLLGTGLTGSYFGHAVSTALFGFGGGLLPPLAAQLIAERAENQMGLATGMQSAASQAGQLLGGAGAGMIAAWLVPNWIFLGASALAFLLFVLALLHPYRELETGRSSEFLERPSKRRPLP